MNFFFGCIFSGGFSPVNLSLQSNLNVAGSRESSRTTSEPPGSYELSWFPALVFKGEARKIHTNRGVQMWFAELSREPATDWIAARGTDNSSVSIAKMIELQL